MVVYLTVLGQNEWGLVGIREGFHEQEVGIFLRAGDKLGEWGVFL